MSESENTEEEGIAERTVKGNRASEEALKHEKEFTNYTIADNPREKDRPEEGSLEYHGLSGSVPKKKEPKEKKASTEKQTDEYHGLSGQVPQSKETTPVQPATPTTEPVPTETPAQ